MASTFARSAAAIAEAALACVLLSGCGSGNDADSGAPDAVAPATLQLPTSVQVFDANAGPWPTNNGRWYSYQQSDLPCVSGVGFPDTSVSPASCFAFLTDTLGMRGDWVRSQGPWWVDPNHAQLEGGNGFGLIHVVAFVQIPGAWQGPLTLEGTTVRLRTRISGNWVRPVAPSRAGDLPARAYLWFQTYPRPVANCTEDPSIGENCTRQSNFIFSDGWQPTAALDQTSDAAGQDFAIAMRADQAARWTCLGAGQNVKYDCMPFEQAVQQVAVMGVILGPVRPCPTAPGAPAGSPCDRGILAVDPTAYFNPGRFELRDFAIKIDAPRAASALRATLRPPAGPKPAPLWNPLRYLDAQALEPGKGVHLLVTEGMAAVRLGVSRSTSPRTFDDAGPQVYVSPLSNEPNQQSPTLYVQVVDTAGRYSRVTQANTYAQGDRIALLLWRDQIVFTKNDEVVHMTRSPCAGIPSCRLNAFVSTHVDSRYTPAVYLQ
jgi:hypothetical protein